MLRSLLIVATPYAYNYCSAHIWHRLLIEAGRSADVFIVLLKYVSFLSSNHCSAHISHRFLWTKPGPIQPSGKTRRLWMKSQVWLLESPLVYTWVNIHIYIHICIYIYSDIYICIYIQRSRVWTPFYTYTEYILGCGPLGMQEGVLQREHAYICIWMKSQTRLLESPLGNNFIQ